MYLVLFGFEPPVVAAPLQLARSAANDRLGSRPCENVHERRNRRIVFSIAFFGQAPPELLVFRLKKSSRTFYAQIERRSFRTASVDLRRFSAVGRVAADTPCKSGR